MSCYHLGIHQINIFIWYEHLSMWYDGYKTRWLMPASLYLNFIRDSWCSPLVTRWYWYWWCDPIYCEPRRRPEWPHDTTTTSVPIMTYSRHSTRAGNEPSRSFHNCISCDLCVSVLISCLLTGLRLFSISVSLSKEKVLVGAFFVKTSRSFQLYTLALQL